MIDRLKGLGAGLWSYECHPCPTNKQERARAKCLEGLLWDLHELGANQLVIESRGRAGDHRDRRTVEHARRARKASQVLVYEHRRPAHEPGLWLADALAGAAATGLRGRTECRDRLGKALRRRHIPL
jgi:hypothetical protein